jgi:hypothetical protein
VPVVQQRLATKVQPKVQEAAARHAKLVARWLHTQFSWRQFLMSWMVLLIASKMVLLALTFQFFTLTSLVSLQVRGCKRGGGGGQGGWYWGGGG